MLTRVVEKAIAFERPFHVAACDVALPAGSYVLETEEEEILGLSFVAYRRVGMRLTWSGEAGRDAPLRSVRVSSEEIEAAVLGDRSLLERRAARPWRV
jgi:hypothetical protein